MKLPASILIFALALLMCVDVFAQRRIDYETLRQRDRAPNVFFEMNVLPPSTDSDKAVLMSSFKIEYNYLRFQRIRDAEIDTENNYRFKTDLNISVDVRKVDQEVYHRQARRQASERSRRRSAPQDDEIPGTRVGSKFWNSEIFATTYEQTQSRTRFSEGFITKELEPGFYLITATITSDGRTRGTLQRRIHIPDFAESERPVFYYLDETTAPELPAQLPLVNVGGNVYYGKDFTTLISLPQYSEDAEYILNIRKASISERDTTTGNSVHRQALSPDHIIHNTEVTPAADTNFVKLNIEPGNGSVNFAYINIPNSKFANSHYRMSLIKKQDGTETILGSSVFQNRWFDMPVSLYNVDVAINMLRFIVDDQKLTQMRRGSQEEKERKFREFWEERNPTPDTEYNELMVEYYRRIDYAYENFTSPTTPGYISDQGRVYINNGPPGRIERRFPGQQQTVEVWFYGNRQFIFRATTGFGDYELIDRRG